MQSHIQAAIVGSVEHPNMHRRRNTKLRDHCLKCIEIRTCICYKHSGELRTENFVEASDIIPVAKSKTMMYLLIMLQHMLVYKTAAQDFLTAQT